MRDLLGFLYGAVRAAWRSAVALLALLALGTLVSELLLRGAVRAARWHELAGLVVMSLSIVAMIVTWIAMLQVLARQMQSQRAGDAASASGAAAAAATPAGTGTGRGRGRRLLRRLHRADNDVIDAIVVAILPFLIFYGAWGLSQRSYGEYAYDVIMEGGTAGASGLSLWLVGGASAAAFALRAVFERIWRSRDLVAAGIAAAIFEGMWMVLALRPLQRAMEPVRDFLASRWVVQQAGDVVGWFFAVLGRLPLGIDVQELSAWWTAWRTDVQEALVMPMVWLVIALVVMARDLEQREDMVHRWRPVARVHRRVSNLPRLLLPFALFYEELREKWVPLLAGLRTMLRAGGLRLLAYVAAYSIVISATDWLARGSIVAAGAHSPTFWRSFDELLTLPAELVGEVVRLALIAVVTAAVLRHEGRTRQA